MFSRPYYLSVSLDRRYASIAAAKRDARRLARRFRSSVAVYHVGRLLPVLVVHVKGESKPTSNQGVTYATDA